MSMKQEGRAARCNVMMRASYGSIEIILGETPTYRSERDCRCGVFVYVFEIERFYRVDNDRRVDRSIDRDDAMMGCSMCVL